MRIQSMRLRILIGVLLIGQCVIEAAVCPHCNGIFEVLGRHLWRCPARVTSQPANGSPHPPPTPPRARELDTRVIVKDPHLHGAAIDLSHDMSDDKICACGRHCKGRRGLKSHQRACGFYKRLLDTVYDPKDTVPPDNEEGTMNPTLLHRQKWSL